MRASSEGAAGRLRARLANCLIRSAGNADFRPSRKMWKFAPEMSCISSGTLDGAGEESCCLGLGYLHEGLCSWFKTPMNFDLRLLSRLQQVEFVAHGNDDVRNTREMLRAFDGRSALRGYSRQKFGQVREALFGVKPLAPTQTEAFHGLSAAADLVLFRAEENPL